jgi:hypothetical protein
MHSPARSSMSLPLAAFVSTAVFPLIIVILHLVQSGHYHPLRQAVSELALGRDGWLMMIAFCSSGIGTLLVALMLRRIDTHPRIAPTLLAVAGLLSFVSAFVHADGSGPTTTHGQIHQAVGIATFLLIIVSIFSLVRAFRRDPAWRPLAVPTLAWALAAVAGFFLVPIMGAADFGVAQRILLGTCLSWVLTVSLWGRRLERREHAATRAREDGGRPVTASSLARGA